MSVLGWNLDAIVVLMYLIWSVGGFGCHDDRFLRFAEVLWDIVRL